MNEYYEKVFNKLLTEEYDNNLKKIQKLTWLPWIGKDYKNTKIFIIAESHYTNSDIPEKIIEDKNAYMNDPYSTREIFAEYPVLGYDANWRNGGIRGNNPTFDGIFKLLISDSLLYGNKKLQREKLCSNIAFMNIIQRPMHYPKKGRKERPNDNDRQIGWNAVIEVIKIISPDICIFAGAEAAKNFNWNMKQLNINASELQWSNTKIGNTYPKFAEIQINAKLIPLKFIRHPGSYFNWQEWQKFVFSEQLQEKQKQLQQAIIQ